jgi:hypothetical protein
VALVYAHQLRRRKPVRRGKGRSAAKYSNGKIHIRQIYMKKSSFTSSSKRFDRKKQPEKPRNGKNL